MSRSSPRHHSRPTRTLVVVLTAWGLWAAGCERTDPQTQAIGQARNTLVAAGAGGSAAAPREVREKNFSQALTTLKDAVGDVKEQNAIAASMSAVSQEGQGGIAAARYRDADAVLLSALDEVKARILLYRGTISVSRAVTAYDPQAEVEGYDAARAERQRELADAEARLAENESKVESLRSSARSKLEEGRRTRDTEASIQARMLEAAAFERPELARQLNQLRRAGQAVIMEGELIEADAARLAPRSVELRFEVDRLKKQIESLERSKAETLKAAEVRATQSSASAENARRVGSEIAASARELQRMVTENLRPAFDDAISKLNGSASKWGQARGGPSNQLHGVSNGSAVLSVASLNREFAESLRRVAQVLTEIAGLDPAVDGSDTIRSASDSMLTDAQGFTSAAVEAYERAKAAFESAASGENADRIKAIAAGLDQMKARLAPPSESVTPPSEPDSSTESPPDASEAPAAPEEDAANPDDASNDPEPAPEGEPDSSGTP